MNLTKAQLDLYIDLHRINRLGILGITRPQICKRLNMNMNSLRWLLKKLEEAGKLTTKDGYIQLLGNLQNDAN